MAVVLGCSLYLDKAIDQGALESEEEKNVWGVCGVEHSVLMYFVHARPVQ